MSYQGRIIEPRRQMEDVVRQQRGAVSPHEASAHGWVSKVFPAEGYGFMETPDGREVYFHRHSVVHATFDQLQVSTEVALRPGRRAAGQHREAGRAAGSSGNEHHQRGVRRLTGQAALKRELPLGIRDLVAKQFGKIKEAQDRLHVLGRAEAPTRVVHRAR